MEKSKGAHFYIDIDNFNEVLEEEEQRTHRITHSIHALDTLFSSVEDYGKRISSSFTVEKITGSRLHMYVAGETDLTIKTVLKISAYAFAISKFMSTKIDKYQTLKSLSIRVGAAYGEFYIFEFQFFNDLSGYELDGEVTTIGYVANIAAKLQGLARPGSIVLETTLYDALDEPMKQDFDYRECNVLKKYDQSECYEASLRALASNFQVSAKEYEIVRNRVARISLGDIEFEGIRKELSFDRLSARKAKVLNGIPLYADVRGFTSKFYFDDSNLDEMANTTQRVLHNLYKATKDSGGVHVQFQGDRELSLFYNVPSPQNGLQTQGEEKKCYKNAVLAAMRMIDAIGELNLSIGVGQSFGTLYATRIGARGEKDNILLGRTVNLADQMEDLNAGPNQIAISNEVYMGLYEEDADLAGQFHRESDCWITTAGFNEYRYRMSSAIKNEETKNNSYNGAWRC